MQQAGRKVDGNIDIQADMPPRDRLLQGGIKNPARQRNDESRLLRMTDEVVGWQEAMFRVLPTNKGFDAAKPARFEFDLWLIVQNQLVALDGAPKITGEGEMTQAVKVLFGIIDLTTRMLSLCRVHGDIGPLNEFRFGIRVFRIECDANTAADFEGYAFNLKRCLQFGEDVAGEGEGRCFAPRIGHKKTELVTTEAGQRSRRRERIPPAAGRCLLASDLRRGGRACH